MRYERDVNRMTWIGHSCPQLEAAGVSRLLRDAKDELLDIGVSRVGKLLQRVAGKLEFQEAAERHGEREPHVRRRAGGLAGLHLRK